VRTLIQQFRPDIVHVHNVADHVRSWSDVDYRWYIHVYEAAADEHIPVIENVNIATEPFRSPAIARYVFVSEYVKQRFARPGDPATVIYPGSDLRRFCRPTGVKAPRDVIGLVYRLDPDKLDASSLDPIVHALQADPQATALVIGGGPRLSGYEEVAQTAGVSDRITFTGYLAYGDLPDFYLKMSVFAAPVHNESFGQVSVFAMGMRLPVAGYRIGALEEIIGDPTLLVPPGDAEALSRILVDLLRDPARCHEIGLRNRQRAEQRFALQTMIEQYRILYQEVSGAGELRTNLQ
jgi:glycosyltransferase involved in cell wall biosynthesis